MSTLKIKCKQNANMINDEILEKLHNGAIYWSDTRCIHWMFDFKVGDVWVENITFNNELTEVEFMIYDTKGGTKI